MSLDIVICPGWGEGGLQIYLLRDWGAGALKDECLTAEENWLLSCSPSFVHHQTHPLADELRGLELFACP
jgi:hypothetical protein